MATLVQDAADYVGAVTGAPVTGAPVTGAPVTGARGHGSPGGRGGEWCRQHARCAEGAPDASAEPPALNLARFREPWRPGGRACARSAGRRPAEARHPERLWRGYARRDQRRRVRCRLQRRNRQRADGNGGGKRRPRRDTHCRAFRRRPTYQPRRAVPAQRRGRPAQQDGGAMGTVPLRRLPDVDMAPRRCHLDCQRLPGCELPDERDCRPPTATATG